MTTLENSFSTFLISSCWINIGQGAFWLLYRIFNVKYQQRQKSNNRVSIETFFIPRYENKIFECFFTLCDLRQEENTRRSRNNKVWDVFLGPYQVSVTSVFPTAGTVTDKRGLEYHDRLSSNIIPIPSLSLSLCRCSQIWRIKIDDHRRQWRWQRPMRMIFILSAITIILTK